MGKDLDFSYHRRFFHKFWLEVALGSEQNRDITSWSLENWNTREWSASTCEDRQYRYYHERQSHWSLGGGRRGWLITVERGLWRSLAEVCMYMYVEGTWNVIERFCQEGTKGWWSGDFDSKEVTQVFTVRRATSRFLKLPIFSKYVRRESSQILLYSLNSNMDSIVFQSTPNIKRGCLRAYK